VSPTSEESEAGWFAGLDPDDADGDADADAGAAIAEGSTEHPRDWPALAVAAGFAADDEDYYDALGEATRVAARTAVTERERAGDSQLIHAVRAADDAERTANELAERAVEWAGSRFEDVPAGIEGVRAVAAREPTGPDERRVVSLAARAVDLVDEAERLRADVERRAPAVAPNLAEMAGPTLAARLIALAGGLESLARKPSGTVQVLGAEDALFAHLAGEAPSPKHGVIYTHEAVRGTRPADRGSAARALAGKLSIAARIDHYAGEYRPSVHESLRERLDRIRARAEEDENENENERADP
jgi:nucleolar protein 56